MALKSPDAAAEMFSGDESSQDSLSVSKPASRGMALPNRAIVGGAVGVGKALKFGGVGLSKLIRAGWRNKRDLGMIGATAAVTASAMAPGEAVDVSKNVASGSVDAIHHPKGAAGSATTETGKALLDAADTAIFKAKQGLGSAGEKLDLPGTNNHGTLLAPEKQEKKN
jgi:hypothetical protein